MSPLHELKAAVSGHGHGCVCDSCADAYLDRERHGLDRVLGARLIAAGVLFLAAVFTANALPALSTVLCILSILTAGYEMLVRAVVNCVRRRVFDETLLMCVVSIAAACIGEGREGAAVMLLFRCGQLVQGYAVSKVRGGIDGLMEDRSGEVRGILAQIRSSEGKKGSIEEFISHFVSVYTPAVLVISVLIAVVSPLFFHSTVRLGIHRALVLMVIACPCAVVISVPLAYYAGVGGAARQGILFRDTASMDAVAHTGAVVLDKKEALEGSGLRVISVKSEIMDADVFLRIAAHACAYSGGMYAESIKAAFQDTIYIELIQSFQEEPGRGITVEVDGVSIVLGTEEFTREHGVEPGMDAVPETSAYLAIDGRYAGRILFGTVPKPDAAGAVTALSWEKDRPIVMVTEESSAAAEKFARSVGISQYYADSGPEEKAAAVREIKARQMKHGRLLFVGDAETDLACFQEADIGVGLRGGSSDAAVRESDVTIMNGSPSGVITAMDAAKHTRSIVIQNILFTLAFKVIVLVLYMLRVCPLWLAVLSDVGVSLAVIVNSVRALYVKEAELPQ